jgi:hypothetical protein
VTCPKPLLNTDLSAGFRKQVTRELAMRAPRAIAS